MLYVQHNIKSNYLSAAGTGDREMAFDILLSEIAKLVIDKPKAIINELKAAGFPLKSDSPSDDALIREVSHALYESPAFAKAMSRQIMLNQRPVEAQMRQGDGEEPKPDYENILKGTSSLLGGLGELFGGKKKAKREKEMAEKALVEKTKSMKRFNGKTKSLGKQIAAAIAITLVIGGIFYVGWRLSQ